MTLTFIIASAIFLVASYIGNLLIMNLVTYIDIRIKYKNNNDNTIKKFHFRNLFVGIILQIYYSTFLATLITKYFYYLNDKHKVFLGCIIPILLGMSLLFTIRKSSKEITLKKYQNGGYENDFKPTLSFWMEKNRDSITGTGSIFGLMFFILYYFSPNFFWFSLKFFFLG